MNVIGIIPNPDKDRDLKYTSELIESIKKHGGGFIILSDAASNMGLRNCAKDESDLLENSDIIVALGGDGTFLNLARRVYQKDKPILGINLGTVGFLTEIEKSDIKGIARNLLKNEFEIEERMMLQAETKHQNKTDFDIALNDVVISRIALSRILHVKTYINDVFVDSFPGDGIIVSSPTGSTAYSLSAGGPIAEPDMSLIIITPICPHILYSRSFLTTGDRVVKIVIDEGYNDNAMVTFDGQKGLEVTSGDEIRIKKATCSVKMIRLKERNFFNVLRSKIDYRREKNYEV